MKGWLGEGCPLRRTGALLSSRETRPRVLQLGCLAAGCALILLYLFMNTAADRLAIYYVQSYLILFGGAFFAISLTRSSFWAAREIWLLALAAPVWAFLSELLQEFHGQMREDLTLLFGLYLLAYPFAAGARDGDRRRGLFLAGGFYLCYTLVQTGRTLLCLLDFLPGFPLSGMTWDGARLMLLNHPNISGGLLMVGVGIALVFFFRSGSLRGRVIWGTAAAAQLVPLALTNSRTIVLLTGGLLGATLFFSQLGQSRKRLVTALAAGLVFIPLFFNLSKGLYQWNEARLIAYYQAQAAAAAQTQPVLEEAPVLEETVPQEAVSEETVPQEVAPEEAAPQEVAPEEAAPQEAVSEETAPQEVVSEETAPETSSPLLVDPNTGEVSLQTLTISGQGSFTENLSSFNGRIGIWKGVLWTVLHTPAIALYGCDNVVSHLELHTGIAAHAHNSWLQVLMRRGVVGLVIALAFTLQALRNALFLLFRRESDMVQRTAALLLLAIMGAAFLEPYLFTGDLGYFFVEFLFLFLAGYLQVWYRQARASRTHS